MKKQSKLVSLLSELTSVVKSVDWLEDQISKVSKELDKLDSSPKGLKRGAELESELVNLLGRCKMEQKNNSKLEKEFKKYAKSPKK